jgi:hypothetical protein
LEKHTLTKAIKNNNAKWKLGLCMTNIVTNKGIPQNFNVLTLCLGQITSTLNQLTHILFWICLTSTWLYNIVFMTWQLSNGIITIEQNTIILTNPLVLTMHLMFCTQFLNLLIASSPSKGVLQCFNPKFKIKCLKIKPFPFIFLNHFFSFFFFHYMY